MDLRKKILVTGATGNVGYHVLSMLAEIYMKPIAAVTGKKSAEKLKNIDCEVRFFNFLDPLIYNKTLKGIEKVFLVRPPALSKVKRDMVPFIRFLAEKRMTQVVFLSLQGVEHNKLVPHYKIEQEIMHQNIPYTFLRSGFFMQNLSTTHKEEIRDADEIFIPAGSGRTSFIDARDIAAAAVKTLTGEKYKNKAYELTGNEALTYDEIAAIFTDVLQRKITYSRPSVFTFFLRMRKKGIPVSFILIMIALYTICRIGKAAHITEEIKELLGREPISFHQFVEDYKNNWIIEEKHI